MTDSEKHFHSIAGRLSVEHKDVTEGKMMSSPGIKYKNKVFAFYHNDSMVFRLGRDFDTVAAGLSQYSLLSPFKSKPPMADWFVIGQADLDKWDTLARYALKKMAARPGK